MSRIGKLPVNLPAGVTVEVLAGNVVKVKGPLGELSQKVDADITVTVEGTEVKLTRPTDQPRHRSLHGLYRALINNMVVGVSTGYTIRQELVGVGYRVDVQGQLLIMSLGFSHEVQIMLPAEVKAEANVSWIGNFDYKQQGKINFTVEKNPDGEPREGVITVSYDKSQLEVKVIQALSETPTNKEIKAPLLQGKYYGNYAGLQYGMYNYYVVFSDLGMDASNMFGTPNARYYFVDLYLDTPPADLNNIVVPNGVYEYDITNSGFANTFTHSCSWYQVNDDTGFAVPGYQIHYEKGKLTVEDNKVTLEVTMQLDHMQKNHTVVYEGSHSLIDCTNEVYQ